MKCDAVLSTALSSLRKGLHTSISPIVEETGEIRFLFLWVSTVLTLPKIFRHLLRLRLDNEKRRLWVDAVRINQADDIGEDQLGADHKGNTAIISKILVWQGPNGFMNLNLGLRSLGIHRSRIGCGIWIEVNSSLSPNIKTFRLI